MINALSFKRGLPADLVLYILNMCNWDWFPEEEEVTLFTTPKKWLASNFKSFRSGNNGDGSESLTASGGEDNARIMGDVSNNAVIETRRDSAPKISSLCIIC